MTVNEEVAAQLAVQDYLEADATLMGLLNGGIFLRSVPVSAATPFVKIDRLDTSDLMVINGHRVWTTITYNIRGITRGPDWTEVRAIADQLDTLLHRQTYTDAYVGLIDVIRLEPFTDETLEDSGPPYLHAGGLYEFKAQAV